jgi:hypothetical protein
MDDAEDAEDMAMNLRLWYHETMYDCDTPTRDRTNFYIDLRFTI